MRTTSSILLKCLGLLLLSAAVLKGHQLLTEAVANADIWSNRNFLILTVEFELVLGIWVVSGLFKKAAWLATLACFSLFSFITLYKGLTGAASCGCFGSVKVNPWITLFAVDLPAVISLSIFRPFSHSEQSGAQSKNLLTLLKGILSPLPSLTRFAITAFITIAVLGVTLSVLALNEPAKETSQYVILEPETWVGKELPILDYIDIGGKLRKGNWLILLYHHDCSNCNKAVAKLEKISKYIKCNIVILPIEFSGKNFSLPDSILVGKLLYLKKIKVRTPIYLFIQNSIVRLISEEPNPIDILIRKRFN